MQTHIKFLEHQYNQAYKELDFETAEEFYRIKEILIDLNEKAGQIEPEVKVNFADGLQEGIDYCQKQIDKLKEIYKDDPMYGLNAIQKYIDVRDHLKSKISA